MSIKNAPSEVAVLGQSLPSGLSEVQQCCTHHDLEKGHPPCLPASGSSWQNPWYWAKIEHPCPENTGRERTAHHCLWHNTDDILHIKHTQKKEFELLTFVIAVYPTEPKGTQPCSKQWAPQALRVVWNKRQRAHGVCFTCRGNSQTEEEIVFWSPPKRTAPDNCPGDSQVPAVDITRPCSISATHSYPGVSHCIRNALGYPPCCPYASPSAEHVLSSTNHRDSFGCCWQGHKRVTSAHVILEKGAPVGQDPSGCRGAPEPLSQEYLYPHPPFSFHVVAPHWHSCWLKLTLTSEDSKAN